MVARVYTLPASLFIPCYSTSCLILRIAPLGIPGSRRCFGHFQIRFFDHIKQGISELEAARRYVFMISKIRYTLANRDEVRPEQDLMHKPYLVGAGKQEYGIGSMPSWKGEGRENLQRLRRAHEFIPYSTYIPKDKTCVHFHRLQEEGYQFIIAFPNWPSMLQESQTPAHQRLIHGPQGRLAQLLES